MARFPNVLRIAVVGTAALASMATSSVQSGDRANNGDQATCPPDEDCSDATPNGLWFGGTPTGDVGFLSLQWPKVTAVGGRQTIRLFTDSDASKPLDLPFTATVSALPLALDDTQPSSVVVAGRYPGSALLRIAEPDTDLLYDRLTIEAAHVDQMYLIPAGEYVVDFDLAVPESRFAVLTGSNVRLTVAMIDAAGDRVVDEGMTIDPAVGLAADPEGYVDTVEVAPTADGPIDVAVHAGTESVVHLSVPAAASANSLETAQDNVTLAVGQHGIFCFRARTADGAYLLGADWTFTASADLTLDSTVDGLVSQCVGATAAASGTATLTARAAGASVDLDVTIADRNRSRAAAPQAPVIEPALAGDRADNAEALAAQPQP